MGVGPTVSFAGRIRGGLTASVVSRSGLERANRFMMLVLLLQRVSYLIPSASTFGSSGYRHPGVNELLIAVTLAWNAGLLAAAWRRGWFSRWMCWADVAWATVLLVAVPMNSPGGSEYDALDWATRFGQAAAALAGVAIEPVALAAVAVAVLLAGHGVATGVVLGHSSELVPELISCLNGLIWFALILGFSLRYLRRQGYLLDQMATAQSAAQAQRAAERAREKIRVAHYRSLHDTVLATLTAIARGHLDHRTPEVRSRCARNAEQVRVLLAGDPAAEEEGLFDRLGDVVAEAEMLGLSVRCRWAPLTRELPPAVAEAMAEAVREALNNVASHAGVTNAWLTLFWSEDSLVIWVVDRGSGFSGEADDYGFGLRQSVIGRMRQAGGEARITTGQGEGTCVELKWPT